MTIETQRVDIGLDSNVLTYLVEAMDSGYDPSRDCLKLRAERVATIRVFLYVGDLFVPPTAGAEIEAIPGSARRTYHKMVRDVLVSGLVNIDNVAVTRRAADFFAKHPAQADCEILAEAEIGGFSHLLTFDTKFRTRLDKDTPVTIATPSDFWDGLNLPRGVSPRWEPQPPNPLASEVWWRW